MTESNGLIYFEVFPARSRSEFRPEISIGGSLLIWLLAKTENGAKINAEPQRPLRNAEKPLYFRLCVLCASAFLRVWQATGSANSQGGELDNARAGNGKPCILKTAGQMLFPG